MTSSNTQGRGQAVKSAARTTQNETLTAAGRAGFVARGVVYVLIGALALQIALSSSDGESADRQGALAQVAGQPFGKVMLWAMVVGFASMALWRGTRAVLTRGPQRKAGSRVLDGGRAVFYAFVCWTTAVYAAGGAFRSVVLGLLGVVLNLLSAAAALGLLVLVFQGTWAEGLLDFNSAGSIGSRVPLFLFVILFGLSMDYQVFVVSRIREAALAGVPTRQAVLDGIRSSASVVTSAAVVMTTVFASFVFLHIIEMKQIGFVLAAAVLLDAFVVRVMVLPSAMLLLGEASWWPSRPRRVAAGPETEAEKGATPPAAVDVR